MQTKFVEPYDRCAWCNMGFNMYNMLSYDGTTEPICKMCDGSLSVPSYMTVVPRPEPSVPVGRAPRKGRSGQAPLPGGGVACSVYSGEASAFSVYKSPSRLREEAAQLRYREAGRRKRLQRKEAELEALAGSAVDMLLAAGQAVEADSVRASAVCAPAGGDSGAPPRQSVGSELGTVYYEEDAGQAIVKHDRARKEKRFKERRSAWGKIVARFRARQDMRRAASSASNAAAGSSSAHDAAHPTAGSAEGGHAPFALNNVCVCAKCGQPCVDGKCCA